MAQPHCQFAWQLLQTQQGNVGPPGVGVRASPRGTPTLRQGLDHGAVLLTVH
jgi:hypothetical protein